MIEICEIGDIDAERREVWARLQQTRPELASPFFSLEFTRAVANVCGDVRVAVIRDGGSVVGFLPFQHTSRQCAGPVASRISEIQGAIVAEDTGWNAEEFLAAAGLSSWSFDCLPAWQDALAKHAFCRDRSAFVDLSAGFDAYRARKRADGSKQIEQAERKARKLQRDCGSIRFEFHTGRREATEALFSWKSSQYQRTGTFDVFSLSWVRRLLHELGKHDSAEFAAIMSALYVRDQIIAVHFGIRSRNVLASWFPAYDPAYQRFSPGLILLTHVLKALPEAGISRVDFGRGDERYKQSFLTGQFDVVEGTVDSRVLRRAMRRSWVAVRQWAESTPVAQRPLQLVRGVRQLIARREEAVHAGPAPPDHS